MATPLSQDVKGGNLEPGEVVQVVTGPGAVKGGGGGAGGGGAAVLPLLVTGWYMSAVLAVISSKATMKACGLPFSLCCSQFLTATVMTYFLSGGPISPLSEKNEAAGKESKRFLITANAIVYTLGFLFTNLAFKLINASFVETVKAGEPLTSVILGTLFTGEQVSGLALSALLPIVAGVAMSSLGDVSFNTGGLSCALASNVCFSARSVFTKRLQKAHTIKAVHLFHHVSRIGLVFLCIPAALVMEWNPIQQLLTSSSVDDLMRLACLMGFNGLMYSSYNLLSYMVLERVPLVTHAVLNVMRRVVIIVATSIYFSTPMSSLNAAGIVTALLGVSLYTWAKSSPPRSK